MKTYNVRAYLVRYYMDFKVPANSEEEAEEYVENFCDIGEMLEVCDDREASPTIEAEILEDE